MTYLDLISNQIAHNEHFQDYVQLIYNKAILNNNIIPNEHNIKIIPKYYNAVKMDLKNFEYRLNDRNYQVGDIVNLNEWFGEFTGNTIHVRITYVLTDMLPKGYCVFGFVKL